MKAVRLIFGAMILLAGIGFFVWLDLAPSPNAQHFVAVNNYRDADCVMQFSWGEPERFSVKQGAAFDQTFKSPKIGFVSVHCSGPDWAAETPGHFRLIDGGLAQITLTPAGEMDVRYEGIRG